VELPLFWIVVHYFADFHFQSHWMAINKSKRWDALALHCAVYSVFWLFLGWTFALITSRITSRLMFVKVIGELMNFRERDFDKPVVLDTRLPLLGCQIDPEKPHWFFTVIGIDQVLHYTSLTLTGYWLGILS
jgi:hypothetical protein